MFLHHRLPCPPVSPQSPRRRPSPSRIRRRLRRAQARATAAQADIDPVHKDEDVEGVQAVKAVQTEQTKTIDRAAQVYIQEAPLVPTDDIHDQVPSEQAEQALQDGGQQSRVRAPHRQEVIHIPSVGERNDYHPRIQQLDGNISPDFPKCNTCLKVLETMDDYNWHFKTEHGREDCRLLRSMLT